MALRFLLVGLVAGLGCDLPDGEALVKALRAGQTWAMERVAMVEGILGVGAEEAVARTEAAVEAEVVESGYPIADSSTIEVVETGDDALPALVQEPAGPGRDEVFESVVAEMALSFGSETAPELAEVPSPAYYEGLAFELNRLSDGVADDWMLVEAQAEDVVLAEADLPAPTIEVLDDPAEVRGERIDTAVRLTGQALQAWFSVLQQPGPIRVSGR